MSDIISVEHLAYTYPGVEDTPGVPVFADLNLTIEEGSFVAVLGTNGCGKSTLAKHFNAILLPSGGKVYVCGIDTANEDRLIAIRRNVGMVFQNPDNQIVANVVEEDVAFGPENLGIASPEIRRRLHEILDAMLADTVKARVLLPDGTYTKKPPSYEPVCAQVLLMKRAVEAAQQQSTAVPQKKRSLWEKLFHRKGR
mgnify:FL=1